LLLLAADTSTQVLSVAIADETRLLAETYVDCGRAHNERLLRTIDWLIAEAGVNQAAIEGYAVSMGPGSFTGLRIGVAALKGLALAHAKPLFGVATLPAMARATGMRDGTVCPLLDARMKEVFGAVYSYTAGVRSELAPMQAVPIQTILENASADTLFIGEAAHLYADAIRDVFSDAAIASSAWNYPRASGLIEEAFAMMTDGADGDAAAVAPIYLRGSQAEEARQA